ncbi:MAG: CapA family protein [Cytophagaceae bacterium]|nr:CapA family protein [Cytophagaceae bacterium]
MPFTRRGRRMVALLRGLYSILGLFFGKKWQKPRPDFEENPRESSFLGAIYLGYKYYYRPPVKAEPGIEDYFRQQNLDFTPPAGFIAQKQITISAGGDLMPYERINPGSAEHLWDDVGDFFFGADVVVANLETPIVSHLPVVAVPEVMLNDMRFNGSEAMFQVFSGNEKFKNGRYRGYDVLSTANNHSLDQGPEGIFETLNFLEKHKVLATGTARSAQERERIPMIERQGINVAFIAWTYSLNKFLPPTHQPWLVNYARLNRPGEPLDQLVADVYRARKQGADIVILLLHTGNAYQAFPSAHTVDTYHRIFEQSGVDVILGSHPHNPQPMERYAFADPATGRIKQGFAIYSLADFVAYDIFVWDRLVPLLRLTVQKGRLHNQPYTQLTNVQVLPVYNWGQRDAKNCQAGEIRFLDLKKTVRLVGQGKRPPFLSDLCVAELTHLNWFCDHCFLPENTRHLLASTD